MASYSIPQDLNEIEEWSPEIWIEVIAAIRSTMTRDSRLKIAKLAEERRSRSYEKGLRSRAKALGVPVDSLRWEKGQRLTCPQCGVAFERRRQSQKYCDPVCTKRASAPGGILKAKRPAQRSAVAAQCQAHQHRDSISLIGN